MTILEQYAEEITETIARKYLNLTVDSKTDLCRLIVRKFKPLVALVQPELPFGSRDDQKKNASQRKAILLALKNARSTGCTNLDLNSICLRYGARIFELRDEGYRISTKHDGGRVYRFTLAPEDW